MKKYEYKVVKHGNKETEITCNREAVDGWRVISHNFFHTTVGDAPGLGKGTWEGSIILEREVPEPIAPINRFEAIE